MQTAKIRYTGGMVEPGEQGNKVADEWRTTKHPTSAESCHGNLGGRINKESKHSQTNINLSTSDEVARKAHVEGSLLHPITLG